MLIESLPSKKQEEEPAAGTQRIQAWQEELDQFLAMTMSRLDSIALALSEYTNDGPAEDCQAASASEMESQATVTTDASHEVPPRHELGSPSLTAPVAEERTQESTSVDAMPLSEQPTSTNRPERVSTIESESPPDPSPSEPVTDPDETMARLNAIKSRLAKQLKDN